VRLIQPFLVACLIAGCASGRPEAHPTPAKEVAPEVAASLPVVLFRLMVIRDWQSPYFIIESEDVDLTLPAALEMGIPAELWIRCAMGAPGYRFEIYWVRPLRA
jgi:hypothetical protein